MRIAFVIYTPGQAYLWSNIISLLSSRGHQVLVVTRVSNAIEDILSKRKILYSTYGKGVRGIYSKLLALPSQFLTCFRIIKDFQPDIIAGAGILEANTSAILRKPCVIFEDTEITPFLERIQWQTTASIILTPTCFLNNLGKKQVRIEGYKELAYLHPNHFTPDPSIFDELGLERWEKYAVVRFNSFAAVHDLGRQGFSNDTKITLVKLLEKYSRVFISAEGKLIKALEGYRLPTPPHRIHHVLNYAHLVIGDSGTMICEAAVLGTPAIRCNTLGNRLGNFVELEKNYRLIYCFQDTEQALQKALELIQKPYIKEEWAIKRNKLLSEKIDVTRFFVEFFEDYPESLKRLRNSHFRLLTRPEPTGLKT